jgi:hypothetical protein
VQGGQCRERQKRELHRAAALNEADQGVWLAPGDRRGGHQGDRGSEIDRIERLVAEKVEVHGTAVAEMQRNRGAAIEHELRGDGVEFVPQPPLPLGEDIEARCEIGGHAASIIADSRVRPKSRYCGLTVTQNFGISRISPIGLNRFAVGSSIDKEASYRVGVSVRC